MRKGNFSSAWGAKLSPLLLKVKIPLSPKFIYSPMMLI
jgi:hypothetical protein